MLFPTRSRLSLLDVIIRCFTRNCAARRHRRGYLQIPLLPVEVLESRQLLTVTFETLADLNQAPSSSFYADQFAFGTNTTYFVAQQPATGAELWQTDGTSEGTHLVSDIAPGPTSSMIESLTTVGDTAWFAATDIGYLPSRLWRSDGTEAGTTAVTWANGKPVEHVKELISFDNEIYFQAVRSANNGFGYFHVSNTPGAVPLEIKLSGPLDSFDITPTSVVVGETLYLRGLHGGLQILHPGDTATTRLSTSSAMNFISHTETELFFGVSLPSGYETWITDGTPGGTHVITLPEGTDWTSIAPLDTGGFRFLATDLSNNWSVWTSDGTTEGTHVELQIPDTPNLYTSQNSVGLSDGTIFFVAQTNSGSQLWKTDGTLDGTKALTDPMGNRPTTYPLTGFRDGIIFRGEDFSDIYRRTGWFLADPASDTISAIPGGDLLSTYGNFFMFIGPERMVARTELMFSHNVYMSDGVNGFSILNDFGTSTSSIDPVNFVTSPNRLLALGSSAASYGPTPVVIQTDGTNAGTSITDLQTWQLKLTSKDIAFGIDESLSQVQVLFPSSAAWQSLKSIAPAAETENATLLTMQGDQVYYNASGLWVTDGTASGTKAITDQGMQITDADEFAPVGDNQVIFRRHRSNGSTELWVTDGTGEGTKFIQKLGSKFYSSPGSFFHSFGTKVVFLDLNAGQTQRLLMTDGTRSGTVQALNITTGSIEFLGGEENRFYFRWNKGGTSELWKTDGTANGTVRVSTIVARKRITDSIVIDERLYFALTDGVSDTGGELWTSDGTPSGTRRLLQNIINGRGDADVMLFSEFGQLYFLAEDQQSGRRIWTSNGTASGTRHVLTADGTYPPFMVTGTTLPSAKAMIGFKGAIYYPGITNEFGTEIVRLTSNTVEGVPGQIKLDDSTTPTLSWRSTFGADAYELLLIRLDTPDKQTMTFTSIQTRWELPAELGTGLFRVWIRGVKNDGSAGRWNSQPVDFTRDSRPVLHSLSLMTTSTSPKISWANPVGTTKTEVWVGDRDRNVRVAYSMENGLRSEFTPPTLAPAQYSVWVRTYGSYGVSEWSTVGLFTVLSPAPGAVSVSVDIDRMMSIEWDTVPDATDYEVQINLTGDARPFLKRSGLGNVTSFRLPQPVPGGQYSVWIRALRSGRVQSSWSNISTVFVRETPSLRLTFPDIQWRAVRQAAGYQIEVFNRRTNQIILAETQTDTVVHLDPTLAPDVYSVRIRTHYADSTSSDWSAPLEFEIFHPPVVIQPKPLPSIDASPVISWNAQAGAENYEIYVSRVGEGAASYQQKLVTGSSHRINKPLPPGNYVVWIRAHYADNTRSLWGTGTPLIIGNPPVLAFTGTAIRWDAINGATRYEVIIRYEDPVIGKYYDYLRSDSFFETSIPMTSSRSGNYRVWVRAIRDEAGQTYTSAWSLTLLFSLQ